MASQYTFNMGFLKTFKISILTKISSFLFIEVVQNKSNQIRPKTKLILERENMKTNKIFSLELIQNFIFFCVNCQSAGFDIHTLVCFYPRRNKLCFFRNFQQVLVIHLIFNQRMVPIFSLVRPVLVRIQTNLGF